MKGRSYKDGTDKTKDGTDKNKTAKDWKHLRDSQETRIEHPSRVETEAGLSQAGVTKHKGLDYWSGNSSKGDSLLDGVGAELSGRLESAAQKLSAVWFSPAR